MPEILIEFIVNPAYKDKTAPCENPPITILFVFYFIFFNINY